MPTTRLNTLPLTMSNSIWAGKRVRTRRAR